MNGITNSTASLAELGTISFQPKYSDSWIKADGSIIYKKDYKDFLSLRVRDFYNLIPTTLKESGGLYDVDIGTNNQKFESICYNSELNKFYCVGEYDYVMYVYESSDGVNWKLIKKESSTAGSSVYGNVIASINNTIVVKSGYDTNKSCYYVSSNGGVSWSRVPLDTNSTEYYTGLCSFKNVFIRYTGLNELYESYNKDCYGVSTSNNGISWIIRTGNTAHIKHIVFINDEMYAIGDTDNSRNTAYIWKTSDGITYNLLNSSMPCAYNYQDEDIAWLYYYNGVFYYFIGEYDTFYETKDFKIFNKISNPIKYFSGVFSDAVNRIQQHNNKYIIFTSYFLYSSFDMQHFSVIGSINESSNTQKIYAYVESEDYSIIGIRDKSTSLYSAQKAIQLPYYSVPAWIKVK